MNNDYAQLDDCELHRLWCENDDEVAYRVLYNRHVNALLGIARHRLQDVQEAEDAVQEVMGNRLSRLSRNENDRDIRPWLVRVLIRVCQDAKRQPQGRSRTMSPLARVPEKPTDGNTPLERVILEEELERLAECVEKLSPDDRDLLRLRYGLEETDPLILQDIAAEFGLRRASAIHARLKRVLERLYRCLSQPSQSE